MMLQPKTWLHCSYGSSSKQTRLRISAAHNEWNHVGMALAAMAQGFFAEEGLSDVELISFDENKQAALLDREAMQVDLLARGAVDVGIDPRTTFVLEAKNQSKPVCIIGARRRNHAFVLVGQKGLKSIQDLRGKTVEAGQRGGANDIMMRQVLQDQGLVPDRDVEISYGGGPMHDSAGAIQAFMEGKYGPAILKTHVRPLIDAGYPVLADLNKLYPSRHDRVTAANEDFARAHPEIVKAFLKCMIRACRFAIATENGKLKNKETFKNIVVNAGFLTSEREQRSFDNLFDDWQTRVSQDLSLPMEGIQLIVDEEKKAGKIARSFDVNHVLRLEALRQAQAELGLER
jgi:ABC-type nitrate/sulfonate/bicarbonate transport system substrate-binding protein